MRATEGVSGMIPRQEYEILSFMHEFYRYPEFMRMITDNIGAAGRHRHRRLSARQRDRHQDQLRARLVPRRRRLRHGPLRPAGARGDQPRRLRRGIEHHPQVHAAGAVGQAPGRLHPQLAGPLPLPDPRAGRPRRSSRPRSWTSSPTERSTTAFTQFNATAELLAFFDHYDCRLGLGDTGPYPLPDGRLLIVRDLFVNEEVFHWSDVCDRAAPLLHARRRRSTPTSWASRRSGSTTSPPPSRVPKNYVPAITGGAVFVREKWDTPMGEVYPVKLTDLGAAPGEDPAGHA